MKPTLENLIEVYDRLWEKETRGGTFIDPSYIVTRSMMTAELRRLGVEHPANPIRYSYWIKDLGLMDHIAKKVTAERRRQVRNRKEKSRSVFERKEMK